MSSGTARRSRTSTGAVWHDKPMETRDDRRSLVYLDVGSPDADAIAVAEGEESAASAASEDAVKCVAGGGMARGAGATSCVCPLLEVPPALLFPPRLVLLVVTLLVVANVDVVAVLGPPPCAPLSLLILPTCLLLPAPVPLSL